MSKILSPKDWKTANGYLVSEPLDDFMAKEYGKHVRDMSLEAAFWQCKTLTGLNKASIPELKKQELEI